MIKAGIRANRYIRRNREGSIQVLMVWGMVGRESAAASYDAAAKVFNLDGSIPESGHMRVIEKAKKAVGSTHEVQMGAVADFALFREAQRQLGTRE